MTRIQFLHDLLPVLSPKFYSQFDAAGHELIFLECVSGESAESNQQLPDGLDKTEAEAIQNHVHIFGKVKSEQSELAKEIGVRIAENLARSVRACYPDKRFMVYLTFNPKDSTIVRFHQIWDDEPIYYADDFTEDSFGTKIFRF